MCVRVSVFLSVCVWLCTRMRASLCPTFVVDEEGVGGQGVLVVGDVLQDVGQVYVHPNHTQKQVTEVARTAHGHDEPCMGHRTQRWSCVHMQCSRYRWDLLFLKWTFPSLLIPACSSKFK